jgi:hypothetical protein
MCRVTKMNSDKAYSRCLLQLLQAATSLPECAEVCSGYVTLVAVSFLVLVPS